MNHTYRKEKNMLYFTEVEDGAERTVSYDMNTGIGYGLRGKPVKTTPQIMKKTLDYLFSWKYRNSDGYKDVPLYIECLYRSYCYGNMDGGVNHLVHLDKNEIAGLQVADSLTTLRVLPGTTSLKVLGRLRPYMKDYLREAKKYPTHNDGTIRYGAEEFLRHIKLLKWLERTGVKVDDYFTAEMRDCLFDFVSEFPQYEHYSKRLAYLLGIGGVYETIDYRTRQKLTDLCKFCTALEKEIPKQDFCRSYASLKKEYKLHEEEFNNKILEDNQKVLADKVAFEDETYKVVIPLTSKEFEYEANEQHNCVFNLYLPKCVTGKTFVCFIRRKDNLEHPLVTCEINRKTGKIVQFLKKYNYPVYSGEGAYNFRMAFQAHLDEMWGE